MNPNNEIERARFFKAVEHSYRLIEPFRMLTTGLVEEYCGSGYGSPKLRREILINILNQAITAYSMSLVANRPRVTCQTDDVLLRPFALKFALTLNQLIQEICLEQTLRQWVQDAFFCVGFVKVHLADSGLVEIEPDLWMDPGKPYASNISLDNFVYDCTATKWSRMQFAGDWYRLPLADVQNSPIYDPKGVAELKATTKYSGEDRQDEISRGVTTDYDELEPMVDLADFWFPRDRKIFTFALDGHNFRPKGLPLADLDVDTDFAPYKKLGFQDVPENIMPASPASQIASLARLANNLVRKQARQAQRQKDVHTYTPAGATGAKKLQRASDGQWIEVEDVSQIGLVKMGGIDAGNQGFLDWVLATTDRMAGNITAKLGLGAQAPTKGQEELIHGAVGGGEANMAQRVQEATVDLIQSLGYLLWKDQYHTYQGQIAIPGAEGYSYPAVWTPDERPGDFFQYKLGIDVHSMPYKSQQQKKAEIDAALMKYAGPLGQLLMAAGGTIDIQKAVELDAEFLNEPRLRELIQFTNLQPELAQGESGGMPAQTSREYIRRSVSGGGQNQPGESQQDWARLADSQAAQAA